MNTPIRFRKNIPFFYDKSPVDFQKDKYESYEMVLRQSFIHLTDIFSTYPHQPIVDFVKACISDNNHNILEIGCSVGGLIGRLALDFPNNNYCGIDYSYQMLKRADEYWIQPTEIDILISNFGYPNQKLTGYQLDNIKFGLGKAEELPFGHNTQDYILSSFTMDRLQDPMTGFMEMYRCLKKGGKAVVITPLNFSTATNWRAFYPEDLFIQKIEHIGFRTIEKTTLDISEPLDIHGNHLVWKCLAMVLQK